MENKYISVEGERLDSIVNKVLGSLNDFERVLEKNPHLQNKFFLDTGDVINFDIVARKEFSVTPIESQAVADSSIETVPQNNIQIEFKEPLISNNQEENLKALW